MSLRHEFAWTIPQFFDITINLGTMFAESKCDIYHFV